MKATPKTWKGSISDLQFKPGTLYTVSTDCPFSKSAKGTYVDTGYSYGFSVIRPSYGTSYCLLENCAHLRGGSWLLIPETDDEIHFLASLDDPNYAFPANYRDPFTNKSDEEIQEEAQIQAIKDSIDHWHRLATAPTLAALRREGWGGTNCALCTYSNSYSDGCDACPIKANTDMDQCVDTPYYTAREALSSIRDETDKDGMARARYAATLMRNYLITLLPDLEEHTLTLPDGAKFTVTSDDAVSRI